jgi:hypothetical protein
MLYAFKRVGLTTQVREETETTAAKGRIGLTFRANFLATNRPWRTHSTEDVDKPVEKVG